MAGRILLNSIVSFCSAQHRRLVSSVGSNVSRFLGSPSMPKPKWDFKGFTTTAFNQFSLQQTLFKKKIPLNRPDFDMIPPAPRPKKISFKNTPSFELEETPELRELYFIHYAKKKKPRKTRRTSFISGHPQMKGVVLKTLIKKPKKPNSANRKCVLVRLSNGKEKVAYVPGVGHNLQEHNIVLVQGGRTKDVPGLRLKVMRGKYDCAPVIKKKAPV